MLNESMISSWEEIFDEVMSVLSESQRNALFAERDASTRRNETSPIGKPYLKKYGLIDYDEYQKELAGAKEAVKNYVMKRYNITSISDLQFHF